MTNPDRVVGPHDQAALTWYSPRAYAELTWNRFEMGRYQFWIVYNTEWLMARDGGDDARWWLAMWTECIRLREEHEP